MSHRCEVGLVAPGCAETLILPATVRVGVEGQRVEGGVSIIVPQHSLLFPEIWSAPQTAQSL